MHTVKNDQAQRVDYNGVYEDAVYRHLRDELEHLLGDYLLMDVELGELLQGDLEADQGGLQFEAEASTPQAVITP